MEPQDTQHRKLSLDDLKKLEKFVKASISSAEIVLEEEHDYDKVHSEVLQEF